MNRKFRFYTMCHRGGLDEALKTKIQIFEDEFTLSFYLDEADDDDEYLLKSKEYFYEVLNNYCQNNKQ